MTDIVKGAMIRPNHHSLRKQKIHRKWNEENGYFMQRVLWY